MFTYKAKLVRIIDGDTVELEVDLGFKVWVKDSFRLAHINAPEKKEGQPYIDARSHLAILIAPDADLTVKTQRQEKYGRWLAEIITGSDTVTVNQKMLDAGHAKPYEGGPRT